MRASEKAPNNPKSSYISTNNNKNNVQTRQTTNTRDGMQVFQKAIGANLLHPNHKPNALLNSNMFSQNVTREY